uniref:N-terminal Ras-GEF domain-containing protein n=1 Tax=Loxodonta africana TaxID=9785 RepID=G3UEP1_LOXAF
MFSCCLSTSRGYRHRKSWSENIFRFHPRTLSHSRCHATMFVPSLSHLQREKESVSSLHRKSSVRTYKLFTIETIVEPLVPAFQDNDTSYVSTFLSTYRSFGTTKQVLEALFKKYGYKLGSDESQDEIKNAISSILGMWLDKYPEDFRELPDFPCLRLLEDYTGLNMPGSELQERVRLLLAQMEQLEPTEAEPEGEAE